MKKLLYFTLLALIGLTLFVACDGNLFSNQQPSDTETGKKTEVLASYFERDSSLLVLEEGDIYVVKGTLTGEFSKKKIISSEIYPNIKYLKVGDCEPIFLYGEIINGIDTTKYNFFDYDTDEGNEAMWFETYVLPPDAGTIITSNRYYMITKNSNTTNYYLLRQLEDTEEDRLLCSLEGYNSSITTNTDKVDTSIITNVSDSDKFKLQFKDSPRIIDGSVLFKCETPLISEDNEINNLWSHKASIYYFDNYNYDAVYDYSDGSSDYQYRSENTSTFDTLTGAKMGLFLENGDYYYKEADGNFVKKYDASGDNFTISPNSPAFYIKDTEGKVNYIILQNDGDSNLWVYDVTDKENIQSPTSTADFSASYADQINKENSPIVSISPIGENVFWVVTKSKKYYTITIDPNYVLSNNPNSKVTSMEGLKILQD